MNIIGWILLGIVIFNLVIFGTMAAIYWIERRGRRGKREGDQHTGAD